MMSFESAGIPIAKSETGHRGASVASRSQLGLPAQRGTVILKWLIHLNPKPIRVIRLKRSFIGS